MNLATDPAEIGLSTTGPAALISDDPLIISTPSTWPLPIGLTLGKLCPERVAICLIPLSWHCNEERAATKAIMARQYRAKVPRHEMIFLGNTPQEVALLMAADTEAFFANHNIFASEHVFRPLPEATVEFDAVYNARPSVMKRLQLAADIERVAYISFVSRGAEAFHSRDIVGDILNRGPGHMLINGIVDGFPRGISKTAVNEALARAAVGLCLSEEEGAMYASIEYMLAGLPIVSTPSRGGRDVFFDPDYCLIAEPTPRAIREAVEVLRDRNIPRAYVRSRTLAKLAVERHRFLALIDGIKERHGVPRNYKTDWTFSGAPFHWWRTVEDHARDFFGFEPSALAAHPSAR